LRLLNGTLYSTDLIQLRVIAKRTRYCNWFGNVRVDKVSVAALAATIDESRALKLDNEISYFWRHLVTPRRSIA
jgi:hypothetical protein